MALVFSDDVLEAQKNGSPIVALESTIITHGMPYPQNIEMAAEVEKVVRGNGACPATIALLNGRFHIGLSADQTDYLAKSVDPMKLSRADLANAQVMGATGGTTVAATMILAHLAGIEVFATGGIGGVHRGAEINFDISADLYELSRTPVAVVSAGPKAILDIPKTMEVLETLGVPVIGYKTKELPAFWSRSSGVPLTLSANTSDEIAMSILAQKSLGLNAGFLIANPIPKEAEIPHSEIIPAITAALEAARQAGIQAKEVTPFLLGRILDETAGKSLVANIALVKNNAKIAAQIAKSLNSRRD